MKYVVTGGAGFIGSTIVTQLLESGKEVLVIDKLDDLLYSKSVKKNRLDKIQSKFEFFNLDLAGDDLKRCIGAGDIVIHCAALPGQMLSWEHFEEYSKSNIDATKKLIEHSCSVGVANFVYSSTSSVYGKIADGNSDQKLSPVSPYGITKLAGEYLVSCYSDRFGIPYKILRYFSVYGPGQRPDMAIQIFLERIHAGKEITLKGDGKQSRDFTYVADCAAATILAADSKVPVILSDISGSKNHSILEVLEACFDVTEKKVPVIFEGRSAGDQDITIGRNRHKDLISPYQDKFSLREGIHEQWEYFLRSFNA